MIYIIGENDVEKKLVERALVVLGHPIELVNQVGTETDGDAFVFLDSLEEKNKAGCFYIKRPCRLGVLVDEVKDYLNHSFHLSQLKPVEIGSLILNPKTLQMSHAQTQNETYLTEKEVEILFLLTGSEIPVLRQVLLDKIWGYAKTVETHTLETHLYRLRQKIENTFGIKDLIVMRDGGYILDI